MKKKLIVLSGFVFGLAPVMAFAQTATSCDQGGQGNMTIVNLLCRVNQILGTVVPVLIALGVVYFVWGVISYVIAGDEEAKKSGRDKIIYGIIGLAVIIAMWGLVGILNRSFEIDSPTNVVPPSVPGFN